MTNDAPALVPLDHDPVQPGFDIVLRGCDRGQVARQIGWLQEQLPAADREMEAVQEALRQARGEAADARRQADRAEQQLQRGKPTFEALGERIVQMLTLAEQEADGLRAAARQDAARIREEVGAEAAAARRDIAEQRRAAEAEAAGIVASAKQEGQRIVTDARRQAAEVTNAAQRQVEAATRQRDAIHAELLRVRERFSAVMGAGAPAPKSAE